MPPDPAPDPTMDAVVTLTVENVGVRGDGIAHHQGQPVYLPYCAPGDRVRARLGPGRGEGQVATVLDVLEAGARQEPLCPHFGACGGCALQHLSEAAYVTAKEAQIRAALAQHGLDGVTVVPLRRLAPGTRRRTRFAIARSRQGAAIGFHARASHRIVDMQSCAVLHPALLALVAPLRQAAALLWPLGAGGAATATLGDAGVDLLLDLAAVPELAALETLAGFAEAQDLARLAWRAPGMEEPVPVAQRRPVRAVFAGVTVDLPHEAFLQASAEADRVLAEAVLAGVGDARHVADLYAGLGTFTFALAGRAEVHAAEGSRPAHAALQAAAARAGLTGRVTAELRDLEVRPLREDELAHFDVVVFDPPRLGARAQSMALAASPVRRVVAVSCNPATFARDARLLVDGGFRLVQVQPIDQFTWSPHVELVAWFERSASG